MDDSGIEHWFNSPAGQHLLDTEKDVVAELLSSVFGYYLVQLEGINCFSAVLAGSPVRHHFIMQNNVFINTSIMADSHLLPLATDSIDLIFMPHTLDFSLDYHQVLREVDRVLIADGKLILIGFNPWSSWGLWRYGYNKKNSPWNAHFVPSARVKDWLRLLGFRIDSCQYRAWMPPLGINRLRPLCDSVDQWLQKKQWLGGGIYIIEATRQISRLTPIMPKWKQRSSILGSPIAEPGLGRYSRNNKRE